MEPIRVLQVLSRMTRGGAETMVMNLYRNIDRSQLQFDFVLHSLNQGDYDDEIKSMGGRMFYVPRYTAKTSLSYINSWNRFFRENHNDYRVIHGHISSTAVIYLTLAKRYKLTTIVHSHNTSSGGGLDGFVKDVLQQPLKANITDHLFACSDAAGEWLYGSRNLPKVLVLKNSVEARKFNFDAGIREDVRRSLGIDQNYVIGHVGRFHEQKNHLFLIDVFRAVLTGKPNAVLLLVGRGELEADVRHRAQQLGLEDSVKFLGVRDDVEKLMQAMDVFVLPSLYEGLPLTVVEAQAAGLPCILADTVTQEVKITDLVHFVPLQLSAEAWAEEILSFTDCISRIDTYPEIVRAGYDVQASANWLQEFYLAEHIHNLDRLGYEETSDDSVKVDRRI
jgi:glycosyltransferase involved in cell wall biosynthesis